MNLPQFAGRLQIKVGAAPFDADDVRDGYLLLLCDCASQQGSVHFR